MTFMVTGHRHIVPIYWKGNPWPAKNSVVQQHHEKVISEIKTLLFSYLDGGFGDPIFITGMALGADQLFADAAIQLKAMGADIKIIAAIPFKGQELKWPEASQNKYNEILEHCEQHIICPGGYSAYKMQARNKWMVNRSEYILALWDGRKSGGTWSCIKYAESKGKKIIVLRPDTLTNYVK